jgi:hypothetical protein
MSKVVYFQRLKSVGLFRLDLDSCVAKVHIAYQDLSEAGPSPGKVQSTFHLTPDGRWVEFVAEYDPWERDPSQRYYRETTADYAAQEIHEVLHDVPPELAENWAAIEAHIRSRDPWVIWRLGPDDTIEHHHPEVIPAEADPSRAACLDADLPTKDAKAGSGDHRLTLQPGTRTVTLDGRSEQITDARAFEVFRIIAEAKGNLVTSKELWDRVAGCNGRLDVFLKRRLPSWVRSLIKGHKGHGGGFSLLLPSREESAQCALKVR